VRHSSYTYHNSHSPGVASLWLHMMGRSSVIPKKLTCAGYVCISPISCLRNIRPKPRPLSRDGWMDGWMECFKSAICIYISFTIWYTQLEPVCLYVCLVALFWSRRKLTIRLFIHTTKPNRAWWLFTYFYVDVRASTGSGSGSGSGLHSLDCACM
jgi:hypothetical protein